MATKSKKLPGNDEPRELFLTLQPAQKIAIRQKLLQALETENIPQVRHKIGDAVAEVARQYADSGRWQRVSFGRWIWYEGLILILIFIR